MTRIVNSMDSTNNNTNLLINKDRIGSIDYYGSRDDIKKSYDSLY